MNQTVTTPVIEEKKSFVGRMLTAVCDRIVEWVCENQMQLSPQETMMFMNYNYGSVKIGWPVE
jgi:hypothetical protein